LYTIVKIDEESSEFVRRVMSKTGVIMVPGWGFGPSMQKAVRLSYGPLVHHPEKIDEAMQRVGSFLGK
jgi:aspartate/methionine/tyrosine aminotransferase